MYLFIFIFLGFISTQAMNQTTNRVTVNSELEKTFLQAAFKGDVTVFSECLAQGVDPNVTDSSVVGGYGRGKTALATICLAGQYLLLPLILNAPTIDVDKADKEGNTALHYAASYTASQTLKLHMLLLTSLIKKGANVNARNNHSETPLSMLLQVTGQPALLGELLIDLGADISLTVPLPNPLNPSNPIVTETIFERVIRNNNPLHLIAFLKSPKGITKPIILKALILTKFGYNTTNWGTHVWPRAIAADHQKANFKAMGGILKRYYLAMQGLGFYAPAKTKDEKTGEITEADWQKNIHSACIPLDLAKKIAWHAAKDGLLSPLERRCLTILFGATTSC